MSMGSSENTNNSSVDSTIQSYLDSSSTKASYNDFAQNGNKSTPYLLIILLSILAILLVVAVVNFIRCKRHKLRKLYRALVYNREHTERLADDVMDRNVAFDAAPPRAVHQILYGAGNVDQPIISTNINQCQRNHEYVNSETTPTDHAKERQPVTVHELYAVIDDVPNAQHTPGPDFELNTMQNSLTNREKGDDPLAKFHHYTLPRTCQEHTTNSTVSNDEMYAETNAQPETKPNVCAKSTQKMEEKPKTKIQNKYMKSCDFNLEIKKSVNIQSCKRNKSAYVNHLGLPSPHLDDNNLCSKGEKFNYPKSCKTSWKSETSNTLRNNKQYFKAKLKEKYIDGVYHYQNVIGKTDVTPFRGYVNADQKLKMCTPPTCVSFIRYVNISSPVRELTDAEMSRFKMSMTRESSEYENPDQFVEYKDKYGNIKRICSSSALPESCTLAKCTEIGFEDYLPISHPKKCQQIIEHNYAQMDSTHSSKASYIDDADDQEQMSSADYINTKTNTDHHNTDPHMQLPPQCTVFSTRYTNYCHFPQAYANCFESKTLQKY